MMPSGERPDGRLAVPGSRTGPRQKSLRVANVDDGGVRGDACRLEQGSTPRVDADRLQVTERVADELDGRRVSRERLCPPLREDDRDRVEQNRWRTCELAIGG